MTTREIWVSVEYNNQRGLVAVGPVPAITTKTLATPEKVEQSSGLEYYQALIVVSVNGQEVQGIETWGGSDRPAFLGGELGAAHRSALPASREVAEKLALAIERERNATDTSPVVLKWRGVSNEWIASPLDQGA